MKMVEEPLNAQKFLRQCRRQAGDFECLLIFRRFGVTLSFRSRGSETFPLRVYNVPAGGLMQRNMNLLHFRIRWKITWAWF